MRVLLILIKGWHNWNPSIEASNAQNASLNIVLFPSTILWSQVTIILGFESLIANSILRGFWKDSSCVPNKHSNIFCLAIHAFNMRRHAHNSSLVAWSVVTIVLIISIFTIVNIISTTRSKSIWRRRCKINRFWHVWPF
jgi:hypothetical protein